MDKFTCACCGYKTLTEKPPGTYEICKICFWEDDVVQYEDPFYRGGANHVSLYEAQRNFIEFGACERDMKKHVREPNENDVKDINWCLIDYNDDRLDTIEISLNTINTIDELHLEFKNKLSFPDFYGMNWDAFWDAITGLVFMPKRIIFFDWYEFEIKFPKDSRILKSILEEYKKEYSTVSCKVCYK